MIILDTHVWFWWVQGHPSLTEDMVKIIQNSESSGLLVSAISLLEVSRAVALGGMTIPVSLDSWLDQALDYPGVRLILLTSQIAAESYRLPEPFHRDPADRILVATSRVLDVPLVTADSKILTYAHVALA